MEPLAFAAFLVNVGIELWRVAEGHPAGWDPTTEDFDRLRRNNAVTLAQFKAGLVRRELPPAPPAQ